MIPIIIALIILLIFCIIDILVLEKKVKELRDWIETLRDENSDQWKYIHEHEYQIDRMKPKEVPKCSK